MEENKKPEAQEEANESTNGEPKRQSRRFLVFYIVGLFSVALVLILLSYLTQVRANKQLESLQTKVTEQTSVAQGAQQQMLTLQNTVQEQQKRLDDTNAAISNIREKLDVATDQKVDDAVSLLYDRYVALDALQQVRRLVEAADDVTAKELITKIVESYGAEKVYPPDEEGSVLVGQNAVEFYNYAVQYGVYNPAA